MTRRHFRHEAPATARDRGGGTGVAFTRPVISVYPPAHRHRESGFTLLEVLIVLTIVGVLAAIVTVPINSYWQRARIETTAGDIRNFLQQAFTESVNQHTPINVTLQQDADGRWVLQLTPPPPAPRTANGTYTIPDHVSLAYNPAAGPNAWPTSGPARTLTCDTVGRAMDPTTVPPHQVTATMVMSISHVRMVDGSLAPNIRHDIQVFPLWNVTIRKTVL
ncbi:MAG: prepilin-type N-terminal cleavage/methylation domain-containing protein [Thermoanaerobaculaceae bacterium]|nr:prepilin-type N-terminal cleavage/methylation domain-containing protein [Thermoanaerobaculaceae bacterium]